jgi:anthranilate synthase component I
MKPFKIGPKTKTILADTITPVSIYLKIRDFYPGTLLLESSEYRGSENSFSFICIQPVAHFTADNYKIKMQYPDGSEESLNITGPQSFSQALTSFVKAFEVTGTNSAPVNGIFGYSSYDAVKYFETIRLHNPPKEKYKIPDVRYSLFKYIIAIDHFKNLMYITENQIEGLQKGEIEKIENLLNNLNINPGKFKANGSETSNITDKEYMDMVSAGKKHCYRGDIFQIVLSRQFAQPYVGDDFNVYRALRSINPSPYLFYFDCEGYRIFGSSPEAQIKIENGRATINPIAGTFKRTGNDEEDRIQAQKLFADVKENSEHVMLVDLARNDLSRHGTDINVETYRDIQFYSHVIHMVSTVSGKVHDGSSNIDMMMATFPAGTLSGAPKFKAMELIDKYENQARGYYGGAIGYIDFNGTLNHAITIRTFLSKNNTLFYQAGAGIVVQSKEESELQEVNNKLGALKKAIEMATEI